MPVLFVSDTFGRFAHKPFKPADIPSQDGKVFIVTGGHAGIGLETTRALLKAGATVYIASRTKSKVDDAIKELGGEADKVKYVELDLMSIKSAQKAATSFKEQSQRLDGIIANAGIMATPYKLTEDGIESQFQTNVIGHFAFIQGLIPTLQATAKQTGVNSRIVMLSSFAHKFASVIPNATPDFSSLEAANRPFSVSGNWARYAQSKIGDQLLARKYNELEGITSCSVHPGFVASDLYKSTYMRAFLSTFITLEEGAISSLYVATSPEIESKKLGGAYFVPFCKPKEPTKLARDDKLRDQLWALCEQVVREKGSQ